MKRLIQPHNPRGFATTRDSTQAPRTLAPPGPLRPTCQPHSPALSSSILLNPFESQQQQQSIKETWEAILFYQFTRSIVRWLVLSIQATSILLT